MNNQELIQCASLLCQTPLTTAREPGQRRHHRIQTILWHFTVTIRSTFVILIEDSASHLQPICSRVRLAEMACACDCVCVCARARFSVWQTPSLPPPLRLPAQTAVWYLYLKRHLLHLHPAKSPIHAFWEASEK